MVHPHSPIRPLHGAWLLMVTVTMIVTALILTQTTGALPSTPHSEPLHLLVLFPGMLFGWLVPSNPLGTSEMEPPQPAYIPSIALILF